MRVIFVPVADRPECATALNTAFVLGHTVGASKRGRVLRSRSGQRPGDRLGVSRRIGGLSA